MILYKLKELIRWHIEPKIMSLFLHPNSNCKSIDLGLAIIPDELLSQNAISYSIGVGEDIEFELELQSKYVVNQWLFDPTPRTIEFMSNQSIPTDRIHFMPFGIWKEDSNQFFQAPMIKTHVSHAINSSSKSNLLGFEAVCRSLPSIMKQLGHEHIHLLKMNVEGVEDIILENALSAGIRPDIIVVTWEGKRALLKAVRWTLRLKSLGWDFLGRKGWYFTYTKACGTK